MNTFLITWAPVFVLVIAVLLLVVWGAKGKDRYR